LKALLEDLGIPVEKTHELDQLLVPLHPYYPTLSVLSRGLAFLSNFAVTPRYPGKRATKREQTSALRWADKVRDACRTLLGIRP